MGGRNEKRAKLAAQAALVVLILVCGACAADYTEFDSGSTSDEQSAIEAQADEAAAAMSVRVVLHHSDFYSLTDPNTYNCAGDAKTYYKTIDLDDGEKAAYDESVVDSTTTIKPSFVKNVSVDLTDSNASSDANEAFGCSLGSGSGVPPVSSCATFDYGAIEGIPTTLGGSFFLVGGIIAKNYTGYPEYNDQSHTVVCGPVIPADDIEEDDDNDVAGQNYCHERAFALAIETLPASAATDPANSLVPGLTSATEAISTWANMSSSLSDSGPMGVAGAAIAHNAEEKKVLVFGGSMPLSEMGPTGASADTNHSFVFDMKKQVWDEVEASSYAATEIYTMPDSVTNEDGTDGACDPASAECVSQLLSKSVGGRALMGYVAAPGFALRKFTADDNSVIALSASNPGASNLDTVDRIIIVGGLTGSDTDGNLVYSKYTHKFNPTFGPEWVDYRVEGTTQVAQWLDSNPSQLLNNSVNDLYETVYGNGGDCDGDPDVDTTNTCTFSFINFGAVPLWDTSSSKVGFVLTAGGFFIGYETGDEGADTDADGVEETFENDGLTSAGSTGAPVLYSKRFNSTTENYEVPALPTYPWDLNLSGTIEQGTEVAPITWEPIAEGGDDENQAPDFGGVSMLPGFDLSNNEVAYFGGVNCRNYYETGTTCPDIADEASFTETPTFNSDPKYWVLGSDPEDTTLVNGIDVVVASTDIPNNAGMAAARGYDSEGNVILITWGGMSTLGSAADNYIYYMYEDSDNSDAKTWAKTLSASSYVPTPAANAALIYSRITRKFYLFGGYETDPELSNSGDTWELTVSGECQRTGTCTFTWTKLNEDGGATCFPDCEDGPPERRGHRMVEVNYNNYDPDAEYIYEADKCTPSSPCSFGIFMEGGTQDGVTTLGDRWMFDPTANGGRGHWQKVNAFPPRRLAAMTQVSMYVPESGKTIHRAFLFGGETGMQSPSQIGSGYFVPPTLGDSHLYNYDTGQWNRVNLLGLGVYDYNDPSSDTRTDEREVRQTFQANSTSTTNYHEELTVLTPPPLSGAVMITRTFPSGTAESTDTIEPLAVPEVYLIGGRLKDGTYNLLSNVYKFCPGSTGESGSTATGAVTEDGHCDAFDTDDNPDSWSPSSDYIGRWMLKAPPSTVSDADIDDDQEIDPAKIGAYLSAAVYDPHHDKIVLYGGLGPTGTGSLTSVTMTQTSSSERIANSEIYEFTFNTKSLLPTVTSTNASNDPMAYQGYWSKIPVCDGESPPPGRYGHSMAFDTLHGQLIIVGGYDSTGATLLQYWLEDGEESDNEIPEIWTAARELDSESNPCYRWKAVTTFSNELDEDDPIAPIDGLAHAAGVFVESSGYNTGYYTLMDSSCAEAGPVASDDSETNKLLAGGVYFDIDREELGPHENLILHMSFIPLGETNQTPLGDSFEAAEAAYFRIHLQSVGYSASQLRQIYQPRYMAFTDSSQYAKTVETLSVLAPPTGSPREEEFLIPLAIDASIDRIRIERYSGSAILIDASLYRMGYR